VQCSPVRAESLACSAYSRSHREFCFMTPCARVVDPFVDAHLCLRLPAASWYSKCCSIACVTGDLDDACRRQRTTTALAARARRQLRVPGPGRTASAKRDQKGSATPTLPHSTTSPSLTTRQGKGGMNHPSRALVHPARDRPDRAFSNSRRRFHRRSLELIVECEALTAKERRVPSSRNSGTGSRAFPLSGPNGAAASRIGRRRWIVRGQA
jgi:hypothetical protein